MSVSCGVLLAVTAWAALWDATLFRIPNRLLLGGWLLGFGLLPGGEFVLKSIFPVIFLWPAWSAGLLGAGDLKLLAVICGYLDFHEWFSFFVCFVLAAGGISLLRLIRNSGRNIRGVNASVPLAVPALVGVLRAILL